MYLYIHTIATHLTVLNTTTRRRSSYASSADRPILQPPSDRLQTVYFAYEAVSHIYCTDFLKALQLISHDMAVMIEMY